MSKRAKIIYRGGGITITRSVSVPDEIVDQLPDEWTDNLVYYYRRDDDKYSRVFRNEFGAFYQGFGASKVNPVGRNAVFIPKNGDPVEETRWGYVKESSDPRIGKYVSGWCSIARLIGHPDTCGAFNLWNPRKQAHWYEDLPVGTDIRPILREQGYLRD